MSFFLGGERKGRREEREVCWRRREVVGRIVQEVVRESVVMKRVFVILQKLGPWKGAFR